MNMKTLKYFSIVGLLILGTNVFAQSNDMKSILNELNGSYDGSYRFSVNGEKQLEIDFFNSSGHFRQDVVYLDFLDPEMVTYNSDENAVTIRCAKEGDKCIDKEIYKLDIIRHSSRINLKEESPTQAENTMALLKKIISLHLESEKEKEANLGETRRNR